MEAAALGIAILALLSAWALRAKVSALQAGLDDVRGDARRHASNLAEEVERNLEVLRRQLAEVASGSAPSAEMILEGRVWGEVQPRDGATWLEDGAELRILDVRSPHETAGGVIPGALLIPIEQLEERAGEVPRDGRRTLVYCAGGGRSAAACEFLAAQGLSNLFNLEGGISSWSGPVAKP